MEKVGILGGTFDPIHNGHLSVAHAAMDAFGLSRVLLMPSGNPPHKDANIVTAEDQRASMIMLAIQGHAGLELGTTELRQQGNTYTADTAKKLAKQYPDQIFYYIVGADALRDMDNWRQPADIFKYFTIVVANRRGHRCDVAQHQRFLQDKYDARILPLDTPFVDISSTQIRERVGQGQSIEGLVPPPVAQYIKEHGLYD